MADDPATLTLLEAQRVVRALAAHQSVLLLAPPGVGKSDAIAQVAASEGLPLRSLLGTQIAPEDVSGIPRIVGERSVFCPPRVLLPERPAPFCLLLDELPATSPEVQKAFYSLLLERRVGEHALPAGTWVVAAGNRAEDRALVRTMSSALVNRLVILHIRIDVHEWLRWARQAGVRDDVLAFILFSPGSLSRPVPSAPVPFSTPRAWANFSQALSRAEAAGILTHDVASSLAFGTVSAEDAGVFCAVRRSYALHGAVRPLVDYFRDPGLVPSEAVMRWHLLWSIRGAVTMRALRGVTPADIDRFFDRLRLEDRFALLVGLVKVWARLGAERSLLRSLREATGIE